MNNNLRKFCQQCLKSYDTQSSTSQNFTGNTAEGLKKQILEQAMGCGRFETTSVPNLSQFMVLAVFFTL